MQAKISFHVLVLRVPVHPVLSGLSFSQTCRKVSRARARAIPSLTCVQTQHEYPHFLLAREESRDPLEERRE